MIEQLIPPVSDSDLRALAQLLVDAVESGAAVSFLAPLTLERAGDWWRRTISASHSDAIFLVARDVEGIVGSVQLLAPVAGVHGAGGLVYTSAYPVVAGTIPAYALDPDGTPHDAVIFYKDLSQAVESRAG